MTSAGETNEIEGEMGLQQSSAMFFVNITDGITNDIDEGRLRELLVADDLVLCDHIILERWRKEN